MSFYVCGKESRKEGRKKGKVGRKKGIVGTGWVITIYFYCLRVFVSY
jgi:hypothetical protein